MKLSRLYVDNFKAAMDIELELSHMTTLVGANGSGKTTFLEALDYFFHPTDIPYEDYKNPNKPIKIAATFTRIPQSNAPVTITRTCTWEGGKTNVETDDTSFKLASYENILGSVHVVFERAEHETDDDGTSKSDLALAAMIKDAIRSEIAAADHATLFAASREYYQSLSGNLDRFKESINKKLTGGADSPVGYAPDFPVDFDIQDPNPEPDIETVFVEKDRRLAHRLAGHGTKRAYHMAALEAYAEMSQKGSGGGSLVLMLVDEPELHQHPQRQRHILQAYKRLASSPNVQIVYSTHSPELVDLDKPEGIYRVSRDQESGIVASPGDRLAPRLSDRNIHKKLVEGIFSTGVVLVEGWRDEATLGAALSVVQRGGEPAMKRFIEGGINIVHTMGVGNMPDFIRFFRALDVPVFAVWDADGGGSSHKRNKGILSALEASDEFEPGGDHGAHYLGTNFLCFAHNADLYFKDWLGTPGPAEAKGQKRPTKGAISSHESLVSALDTEEFRSTHFAMEAVPRMCDHFSLP